MSWLCLQGAGVVSWDPSSSEMCPSVLSKLIPTASKCYLPDNETATSPVSQSGTTLGLSKDCPGEEELTKSRGDSPAKTSPHQGQGLDLQDYQHYEKLKEGKK